MGDGGEKNMALINTDKFCNKCGSLLLSELTDDFDMKTGEQNRVKVCPTSICGHYGVQHDWKPVKGWFCAGDWECSKCHAYTYAGI